MHMKPKMFVTVALLAFILGGVAFLVAKEVRRGSSPEKSASAAQSSSLKNSKAHHKVIAYYFHGTARCPSCMKIEAYTKETIQRDFAQAIKDGRLEWRVINVDEPGNEHFTKDYQLYTKSVIIAEVKDGRQIRWKNLEKVWELLHGRQAFGDYIRAEISAYLKGI